MSMTAIVGATVRGALRSLRWRSGFPLELALLGIEYCGCHADAVGDHFAHQRH
jgi:hypothetical protein